MPNLQVKDVPTPVHAELRRRAAQARMTLRDYLLDLIERDLAVPSAADWLERVRAIPPTRLSRSAADVLREERERWESRGRRR